MDYCAGLGVLCVTEYQITVGKVSTVEAWRLQRHKEVVIATTQLNLTQSWVGLIFLRNHKPQPKPKPIFFQTQIQYVTLFKPN